MKISKSKLSKIINEEIERHHVIQEARRTVLTEGNNISLGKVLRERFEKLGGYYFEAIEDGDKELAKTLQEEMNKIFEDLTT
tara:strand:- start:280 stop:525 length:246 start_codon:yes stop_codon:yes gene_type:complete